MNTDHPHGYRWVACRCGKEWQASTRQPTQALVDSMLTLIGKGQCRSCEADWMIKEDRCPEGVSYENGSSACRLFRLHVGRCEPYGSLPEASV